MKQTILLMLVFIFLPILPGCWDLEEVDRRAFITALGIDVTAQGKVVFTAHLPLLQAMLPSGSVGGNRDGKNFHSVSAVSGSLFSAFRVLQTKTSRNLVIQENKLIIIGARTARGGVGPVLDWLMRNPKSPPQALLFITRRGSARKLLSVVPATQNMPGLEFVHAVESVSKRDQTYFIPAWRFREMLTNEAEDLFAPLLDFDARDGQYIKAGVAVFNGERMAGALNGEETQIFGILTNQMKAGSISYQLGAEALGQQFAVKNVRAKTRIQVLLHRNKPSFLVRTAIKATLAEMIGSNRKMTPEFVKQLDGMVAKQTRSRMIKVIKKLQALHSDPIDFGEQFRAQHDRVWKKTDWKAIYPSVPFRVIVRADIVRNGILR